MNKFKALDIPKRAFKISIALVILSFLFSLMHWPFTRPLALISQLSISISSLLIFATKKEKSTVDYVLTLVGCLVLFNVLYPYLSGEISPLYSYQKLLLIGLIIPEGFSTFSNTGSSTESPKEELDTYEFGAEDNPDAVKPTEQKRTLKLSSILLGVGILPVLLGLLFKIQHYPGASALLISGFVLSAVGVFLTFIKK